MVRRRVIRDYADADDLALIVAAERDPEAFGVFYDRHARSVLGYFVGRTFDREAAFDLTADTFVGALEALGRYDPDRGVPRAWLFGIARHQLFNWLRQDAVTARARKRVGMRFVPTDDDSTEHVHTLVDAERSSVWLQPAIDELSPRLRQAIELRVLRGHSYDDIARQAGCSVRVARVRVCRALAHLSKRAPTPPSPEGSLVADDS